MWQSRYPFLDWFNGMGHYIAGEPTDGSVKGLVTVRLITLINVPVVWVLFPVGAWVADRYSDIPMLVLCRPSEVARPSVSPLGSLLPIISLLSIWQPLLPQVLWMLSVVNGLVGHVILGLATTADVYNPGFLQSIFMSAAGIYYLIALRKLHPVLQKWPPYGYPRTERQAAGQACL